LRTRSPEQGQNWVREKSMQNRFTRLMVSFVAGAALVATTGCPDTAAILNGTSNNTNNGGNTNNKNNNKTRGKGSNSFTVTKTNMNVHVQGKIAAGDDVIVFGTGGATGVDYIIPSGQDTAGRGIPGGSGFSSYSFAIGDRNVFLTDSNFQVSVFN